MDQQVKVRPSATAWRIIDRETILLHLESSEYLGLNETGTILWPAMVQGATVGQLAQVLVDEFGLDGDEALADVHDFVAGCRAQGILEE